MHFHFCERLIEDAKEEAIKCLETGEEIRPVPFGDKESLFFVSRDPYKIVATTYFVVEGETFFFGHKMKE